VRLGPELGEALVASDCVDMISFTGSTAVGLQIQEVAARRLKRTLLELGGKSPQIVFADADRDKALAGAAQVWTFHTGQICIAGTRLLIRHRSTRIHAGAGGAAPPHPDQ
jgi:aldehyde dehydrogenase (NAD+)